MTDELIVNTVNEAVIVIDGGPTLTTSVGEETATIVTEFTDPILIDLNAGPRGEPGAAILTGSYPPSGLVGVQGDAYIVTQGTVLVGEIYRKTGPSSWTDVGNVRGPAGGVNTVNTQTGPDVILTKADIGLANVTNEAQVTLSGAQTISGTKTFTDAPVVPDNSFAIAKVNGLQAALNASGNDATLVHITGAETITGAKTFTAVATFSLAPVVPDNSFAIAKVTSLQTSLNAKEATIAAGTTAQYWRGDKSWQTLDKATVGLANVDNTSDANKPVSSATQTALNTKEPTIAGGLNTQFWRGDKTWVIVDKTYVGLNNVVNLAQVDLVNAQTIAGIKTFSASPIVPTPTTGTQAANMTYVDTRVAALVNAAPAALDTLNELATALGNDANFATTINNNLALKAPLASPTFTGTVNGITKTMVGLGNVNDVVQVDLTTAQTIAGIKTFSSAPVVPSGSFAIAATTGLQTALDTAVTLATAQTISGTKTFSAQIAANGGLIVTTTTTGTLTINGAVPTIEIGRTDGVASSPFIDFHSGATATDYDARIAVGGGSGSVGGAALYYYGLQHIFNSAVTATSFNGSGNGLTAITANSITQGLLGQAYLKPNIQRIEHGATAGTARPTGSTYVEWVGSVTPTNMVTGDTFINTAASGGNPELYPSGMVTASAIASSTAPSGWYFCEGQQILISGDTVLYNALTNNGSVFPYGTNTNGAGAAGSTYFRLPDIRGRVITHLDGSTEFAGMGTVFGTKTVSLLTTQIPAHNHGVSDPGHSHSTTGRGSTWQANDPWGGSDIYFAVNAVGGYPTVGGVNYLLMGSGWYGTGNSGTGISTTNTGGGGSHNNVQPTISLRYMVKR